MGCTLYFIRHGQSLGNKTKTFLGHTDLDLSELGYRQAECTAKYLNNIDIDAVFSSDLLRALNTCNEYLKISGKTAVKDQKLREIFAGDWEGKTFDELQVEYKEAYNIWLTDIGNSCPDNGEAVKELTERVVNRITEIANDNDGKTVAIFTHATVIRSFFNFAYGKPVREMKNLPWSTNASVSVAKYDNGKFEVLDYSIDSHLSEYKSGFPANV